MAHISFTHPRLHSIQHLLRLSFEWIQHSDNNTFSAHAGHWQSCKRRNIFDAHTNLYWHTLHAVWINSSPVINWKFDSHLVAKEVSLLIVIIGAVALLSSHSYIIKYCYLPSLFCLKVWRSKVKKEMNNSILFAELCADTKRSFILTVFLLHLRLATRSSSWPFRRSFILQREFSMT